MREFKLIVDAENNASPKDLKAVTRLDFAFHHLIGLASGNLIYPLLINSFKPVYVNFTTLFFSDPKMVSETVQFHRRLVKAIEDKYADQATAIMRETLVHGERHLRTILSKAQRR
jgi:DNA-binding FadR family transcriptional regulator